MNPENWSNKEAATALLVVWLISTAIILLVGYGLYSLIEDIS